MVWKVQTQWYCQLLKYLILIQEKNPLLKTLNTGLVLSEAVPYNGVGARLDPLIERCLVRPLCGGSASVHTTLGSENKTYQVMVAVSSRPWQTRRNTQNMNIKFISVGIISKGKNGNKNARADGLKLFMKTQTVKKTHYILNFNNKSFKKMVTYLNNAYGHHRENTRTASLVYTAHSRPARLHRDPVSQQNRTTKATTITTTTNMRHPAGNHQNILLSCINFLENQWLWSFKTLPDFKKAHSPVGAQKEGAEVFARH